MPRSMASRGEAIDDGRALEPQLAAQPAVDAEDDPRQLGAAGADQAGEAQDLAARAPTG